jgi:hypothetical protein
MFEQIVVPTVANQGFPQFAVADDIYWGDLGVTFGWNLRSIPDTKVLESLGPEEAVTQNLDLLNLISETKPESTAVESLGAEQPLVIAARRNPGMLVRAVFAPEADRFAPRDVPPPALQISEEDAKKAQSQGEHLGLMLIAVEHFACAAEADPELVSGTTDDDVLEKINKGVLEHYKNLAETKLRLSESETEHLGRFGDAIGWAMDHLSGMVNAAKEAANSTVAEAKRGVSLIALKQVRDSISRRGLRFLGDVFVYLHHGKVSAPSIFDRVKTEILALGPVRK